MKKIISLIIASLVLIPSISFAADTEKVLYKSIIVTNQDIKNIYGKIKGEKIIKGLDNFFTKLRGDKNKTKLSELENKMGNVLKNLSSKTSLNYNEKIVKKIATNIYSRAKVINTYLLK